MELSTSSEWHENHARNKRLLKGIFWLVTRPVSLIWITAIALVLISSANPDSMAWGVASIIAVVLAPIATVIIAWLWLWAQVGKALAARRAQAAVTPDKYGPNAAALQRIRKEFPGIMRDTGLTLSDDEARNRTRAAASTASLYGKGRVSRMGQAGVLAADSLAMTRTPKLLEITELDADRSALLVELLPGQTQVQFEDRHLELATSMRVQRVSITQDSVQREHGHITMSVFHRDPLRGVTTAADLAGCTSGDTQSIAVPVGRLESGEPLVIDLSEASHIGLQGMTRSGKSVFMYGLLGPLAADPRVQVWGSDPSGLLLKPWKHSPRVARGTADMPAHVAVLRAAVEEMDRRIAALEDEGTDAIRSFTPERPLMVVVLEELPGLLAALEDDDAAEARKPAERLKPQASRLFGRLLREGAKAGVRVIAIAQRHEAAVLGGDLRAQLGTTITMKVDETTSIRMLHPSVPEDLEAQVLEFEPGQGIVQTPKQRLTRFRAALVDYEQEYRDLVPQERGND